jgi:predicted nucleic acid-binding protein
VSGTASGTPVVSNTTPLITLAGVGLLDTLKVLYGQVWIPDEVFAEYQAGTANPLYPTLVGLSWIVVQPIPADPHVPAALDAGETAAISLALATQALLLLIDEHAGRTAARQLGLTISGSLGVLIETKRQQLISLIRPYLEQTIAQGRYISPQLRQQTLPLAGE